MNAALLRCPLCGGTCQSLMRSLESGLPECPGEAGHRLQAPANDNEPPVTGPKIECRLGAWKMGRCPHRSCEIAGECTASTPGNDNGLAAGRRAFFASLTPEQQQAALDYRGDDDLPLTARPCQFPDRVLP